MKKNISKLEAKEKIEEFFFEIKSKSPKEIKKIKRLAMGKKIPLKEKRKLFCSKCLTPYKGSEKVRIKDKKKSIECLECKNPSRWRI